MEVVMKLINELVSTSKSLKFLLIVAAIMISLSSSINAANIRPKYDDEEQSSSSKLTTNNEPTNVDMAAANSNHNNKLNTQLQLVRLVNLLRALESDPSFYRNYVEQKATQYYNSADDVDEDEDDDRKLSAELNELYQDYSDSNGPEQTPSTIIKKILPDTHRSKRVLNLKRDCHLGLGMGYLCHAYSITKFSQHQKLMTDPQGPGK